MAIVALVCVFICPPAASTLGVVALIQIARSNGELRGKSRAIASIIAPFVLVPLALFGAWPDIERYNCRAKQAYARDNLRALAAGESSVAQELGRFSADVDATGFSPRTSFHRYTLLGATEETFLAEARGIGEMEGDLWSVDQGGDPRNIRNVCDEGPGVAQRLAFDAPHDTYVLCSKGRRTSSTFLDAERGVFIHARGRGPRALALADLALATVREGLAKAEPWRTEGTTEGQPAARQAADAIRRASAVIFANTQAHGDEGDVELDVVRFFAVERAAIVAHVGRSQATLTREFGFFTGLTGPHPPDRRVGVDADVAVDLAALVDMKAGDVLLFAGGTGATRLRDHPSGDGGDAQDFTRVVLDVSGADDDGAALAIALQRDVPVTAPGCDVHAVPRPPLESEPSHVAR